MSTNTNYTWDDLLARITKLEAEKILVEEAFKAAFHTARYEFFPGNNLFYIVSKDKIQRIPKRIESKVLKAMVAMGMIKKEEK